MGRRAEDIPPPVHAGVQRVVLLGYMASGKSTVGAALARRLEWDFLDFDVEIEQREGRTVKEIIDAVGENGFRDREAALTGEASSATRLVMAPGGGWITRPELLGLLGAETLRVWLRVSIDETVRRLREDSIDRPFKELDDPTPMIAQMVSEREPLYRLADVAIPTDGRSVESIAFEIEQTVRTRAGCAAEV
jgi:shikimate kinase